MSDRQFLIGCLLLAGMICFLMAGTESTQAAPYVSPEPLQKCKLVLVAEPEGESAPWCPAVRELHDCGDRTVAVIRSFEEGRFCVESHVTQLKLEERSL